MATAAEKQEIATLAAQAVINSQAWKSMVDQQQTLAERVRDFVGDGTDGRTNPKSVVQQVFTFKPGGMLWSFSTFTQRIGKALGLDATKP